MREEGGEANQAAVGAAISSPGRPTIGGVIGAIGAWLVFLGVLTDGHFSLLRRDSLGNFFDVQAHALLAGHWNVPPQTLGPEPIFVHGKAFIYYGPWPAILRFPIAIFTDRFDGRLTQLSMLLAFTVAMVFTVRVTARIRELVRPDAPVTRLEQWAVGGFVFVVGAGSVLQFLGSAAFLYHEAELWGAALTIAAFDAVLAYIVAPTRTRLLIASLLTTLAFLSRGSVGSGPVAALALLLAVHLWRRGRRLAGMPTSAGFRREGLWLLAAVALPVVLYAYVNDAKFGSLFTIPADRQILYSSAARRAAFAANGNSLFGVKFVPTSLVQLLRPDGLRLTSMFPWVSFPAKAHVIGGAVFDTIDNSTSLTALMPALAVLSLVGAYAVVVLRSDRTSLAALRIPALGAVAALPITLGIAFIAQRYMSDFVPILVLLGAAGLQVVIGWRPARPVARRIALTGLAVIGAFSVWANVGLAVLYQRLLAPTYVTEASISNFVGMQVDIHRRVPGGQVPDVGHGARLPNPPGPVGNMFVIGDCEATYWSNGTNWIGVDRTRRAGHWRLRVVLSGGEAGRWQPLLVNGRPGAGTFLAVRIEGPGRARAAFRVQGDRWLVGPSIPMRTGRASDVDVVYDPRVGRATVRIDGHKAVDIPTLLLPLDHPTVGRSAIGGPVATKLAGTVAELPTPPTLCRKIVR